MEPSADRPDPQPATVGAPVPPTTGGPAPGGGVVPDPAALPLAHPEPVGPAPPVTYDPYAWGRPAPPSRPSPRWMRLPSSPPVRWGIGDVFLGLLAFLVSSIVFTIPGVVVAAAEGRTDLQPTGLWGVVALLGGWVGFVGWLFVASRRKGAGTLARDFGFRFAWIDPVMGFGVGFATLIVTGIVNQAIAAAAGQEPAGNAEAIFSGQRASSIGLVLMGIGGAIGAPIVEELFFRGLTLRAIERRFGPVAGVIGSSVVFTLLHFQPGDAVSTVSLFLVIGVYAVVLALLTRATGRLGPATFAHMTINGISVSFLVYSQLWTA